MTKHLSLAFAPAFKRGQKRITTKYKWDLSRLESVLDLIAENSNELLEALKQCHTMHKLGGEWKGRNECHVANMGDCLLAWQLANGCAFVERTDTHDELFRH